jgi:hypothetical protein
MKLDEIIRKHLNKVVKENDRTENYMFFSNLQQIHRQCEMLMKMNPQELDQIIQNGHDWADDHVSEAKNNMDQVFDFFMNETKSKDKENVTADMDQFSLNEEGQLDEKCWDGYKQVGGKKKNGKMVPNCVPTNEASSPAQQAAIAINMKKQGKSPKNETTEEVKTVQHNLQNGHHLRRRLKLNLMFIRQHTQTDGQQKITKLKVVVGENVNR